MKYEELKNYIKEYERYGIGDAIYLELVKVLYNEGIQKDTAKFNEQNVNEVILFLATWGRMGRNVERKDFDRERLIKVIGELRGEFDSLSGEEILSLNFSNEEGRNCIKKIYLDIKRIPHIGATGTSKIMHLLNPNLFIMWDEDIRKKITPQKVFNDSPEGYIEFLSRMQGELKEALKFRNVETLRDEIRREVRSEIGREYVNGKTLAKLVDEYCWAKVHHY